MSTTSTRASDTPARESSTPIRDRYDSFFLGDFQPLLRQDQQQGAQERSAYADEYAAFQLWQINKRLGRLIELLEQSAGAK